jgi:choline dehydrogenase-like flavoprotein
MSYLYEDPQVTLLLEATAQQIEMTAGLATGVSYLKDGKVETADADLVVLGANAIFNPYLMQRSGIVHPMLGKRLCEQVGVNAYVDLQGMESLQGSTSITGHGYMLYDGEHRSQYAACLIESSNALRHYVLRLERGKWQQRAHFTFIFENLPSAENYVEISSENPELPATTYTGHSDYTQRGIDRLPEVLPQMFASLPVENINISPEPRSTEAHIIGTTVMGDDPDSSIVDKYLVHHQIRNLVVLGSSVFPSCAPANPTLTLTALSLLSAEHLLG